MFICSASKNCHGLLQKSLVTRRSGMRIGLAVRCHVSFLWRKSTFEGERSASYTLSLLRLQLHSVRRIKQRLSPGWYRLSKCQNVKRIAWEGPPSHPTRSWWQKLPFSGDSRNTQWHFPLVFGGIRHSCPFQMMSEWMLKRVIALLNHTFENARLVDKIEVKGTKRMFCNTK